MLDDEIVQLIFAVFYFDLNLLVVRPTSAFSLMIGWIGLIGSMAQLLLKINSDLLPKNKNSHEGFG
jgi:hypothetical protein